MNHEHIQKEISIIRNMIEKTKRDTAESGSIFLFIGIACILYILVVTILEKLRFFTWVLPVMISMTILMGIAGYFFVARQDKAKKAMTWPQKINRVILAACSIVMILTGIVFRSPKSIPGHCRRSLPHCSSVLCFLQPASSLN